MWIDMSMKKWVFHSGNEARAEEIAERFGMDRGIAEILASRSMKDEEIQEYLGETPLEDPFALVDMDKAVARLEQAVEQGEKIAVYGDYDCDGVTSTYILYTYLENIGAEVSHYIPERNDGGYGLNRDAIQRMKEEGVNLVVTVDNGITAIQEAALLDEMGIDLIVTDHHTVGEELPQAVAVVNPHRSDCPSECKLLAGVGVVFKLITAMEGGDYETTLPMFGDFVAIGTIGDVVPLVGENRTLVKRGLRLLEFSENLGLLSLFSKAKIGRSNLSASSVAFGIVPRINAAGRFNQANLVFRLFSCEEKEQAETWAQEINEFNAKRQKLEQEILEDVQDEINKNPHTLYRRILVFAKEGWPHGVIGIAAARLTERYGKPVVLLSVDGEQAVGSARSIQGFSIYKALAANQDLCLKWGGHALAAGMTIRTADLDAFDQGLNRYARESFKRMPDDCYRIDRILRAREITLDYIRSFSALEPFGCENPAPLFLMKNVRLEEVVPLAGGKHLKLKFFAENQIFQALLFGVPRSRFYYKRGTMLNLLVSLEVNQFNGIQSVSVKIKDLRPVAFEQYKFFSAKWALEDVMREEELTDAVRKRAMPTRNEFAAVYKMLNNLKVFEGDAEQLYLLILRSGLNFCKLSVILEVLQEQHLMELTPDGKSMKISPVTGRVDLSTSPLLRRLQPR